jgi:hypothetical protein
MRSITVSTDTFARIWSLRQPAEDTEDDILRRILGCSAAPQAEGLQPLRNYSGLLDPRSGVLFPEGFEVFRIYLGVEYRARVLERRWVLQNDQRIFQSLNELSRAIGAKTENAWINWLYVDDQGARHPVSHLRDPNVIAIRSKGNGGATQRHTSDSTKTVEINRSRNAGDGTWRDDVRFSLQHLGGKSSLLEIYKEVEVVRKAAQRSVPPSLEATVRRTLEDHSSDSDNYRGGPDIFYMPEGKGAGVWALR